ncbi:YetF domain-containing protein [Heyndrickxia sporothermodurans]|uniref:YetF domain-containing protein n=1 Tax=Heyndrickxia sporothermodurans TaxID=46224 RepID=UPI0035D9B951
MDSISSTIIRTFIGFFVLFILIRLLGKKQISQMSFFSYITGLALGNIVGEMVIHKDIKIIDGITGIALWVFLTASIEFIVFKSSKARVLLDGEPTILIKHGKIIEKALSSNKLNMDDITMLLRIKNVFAVSEVEYAILEPNGQLSVLKKEEYEPVTKKDSNILVKRRPYMPTELIVDGKIISKNLTELNINENWLTNELHLKGFQQVEDIFYAELQTDGTIYVDAKIKL